MGGGRGEWVGGGGVRGNLFAYKNPFVSGPLFLSTFVTIEKIMIKTESKLIYP